MTTNTLEQIKQAEDEAKKTIELARQNTEKLIKEAEIKGENSFANIDNQMTAQINEVIENAKKDIQNLKIRKERELENVVSKLNSIDKEIIDATAKIVVKQIIK